jgi:hypothetical protein
MINLDLSALTVESFTIEGGPERPLIPILTDAVKSDCCHTELYEAAETHERICTTV